MQQIVGTLDPRIASNLKKSASINAPIYTVTNVPSRGRSAGNRRKHSSGGKRRGATTARLFS